MNRVHRRAALGYPAERAALGYPAERAAMGYPAERAALGYPAERAALGYPAERAALGGGKYYPLLTPEPMVGEERARRLSKTLNVRILMSS